MRRRARLAPLFVEHAGNFIWFEAWYLAAIGGRDAGARLGAADDGHGVAAVPKRGRSRVRLVFREAGEQRAGGQGAPRVGTERFADAEARLEPEDGAGIDDEG